jgi:hypothetical protein
VFRPSWAGFNGPYLPYELERVLMLEPCVVVSSSFAHELKPITAAATAIIVRNFNIMFFPPFTSRLLVVARSSEGRALVALLS